MKGENPVDYYIFKKSNSIGSYFPAEAESFIHLSIIATGVPKREKDREITRNLLLKRKLKKKREVGRN